ncbi:MAG TPA: serine/threonine-protein kinase [Archangium sp.]
MCALRCISAWPVLFGEALQEVDLGLHAVGPVLYVALRFSATAFTPALAQRFSELVQHSGGVEFPLNEYSKQERGYFLTRLEQCVELRARLSPDQVVGTLEQMLASAEGTIRERRGAVRSSVTVAATVKVEFKPLASVLVTSLSSSGAFIRGAWLPEARQAVDLTLWLPGKRLLVKGHVANLQADGVAVRFVASEETERALVEALLELARPPPPVPAPLPVDALIEPPVETTNPDAGPMPRLGSYELVSMLGKGGRGEVFFARGVQGSRKGDYVAIKRLTARQAMESASVRALLAEALVLAQLDHPSIVKLLEVGTNEARPYLVLEAFDARDLAHLVRRLRLIKEKLPVDVALYAGTVLLDALAALHATPLERVHCDVSPHNLLVSRTGQLKLADFGSIRHEGERVPKFAREGRPSFLSPEALDGKVTAQVDLWAAAVTIWELLTLESPFTGDTFEALSLTIKGGLKKKLRQLRPEVTPALELVLTRALSAKQDERFASAKEFSNSLKLHLDAKWGNDERLGAVVRMAFPLKAR